MQEKNQILIVTQKSDYHADVIISKLEAMPCIPIRFNTDDFPDDTLMSMKLAPESNSWSANFLILDNQKQVNFKQVKSIWWRRPGRFNLASADGERERVFLRGELDHGLRSLWNSTDCYWLNHPEDIRRATYKGEQLIRASRMGFTIPPTLITSDPEAAKAFYYECDGQIIYKVMTDPYLGMAHLANTDPNFEGDAVSTMTTKVEDVAELEAVRGSLCLFQKLIPKQSEFRVTIIGNSIFVAEIKSQESKTTKLDWRYGNVDNLNLSVGQLPMNVQDLCFEFIRSYSLNYSAIDLILTPSNEYVFLENNPNGQFLFVENLEPRLKMSDELASCLVDGGVK